MKGKTAYNITVSIEEVIIIRKFLEILDDSNCPINLNDHDYVTIMNSIANCEFVTGIENIRINYDEGGEEEKMSREDLSNKITDMILNGSSDEEILEMVEYSKRVMDQERRNQK